MHPERFSGSRPQLSPHNLDRLSCAPGAPRRHRVGQGRERGGDEVAAIGGGAGRAAEGGRAQDRPMARLGLREACDGVAGATAAAAGAGAARGPRSGAAVVRGRQLLGTSPKHRVENKQTNKQTNKQILINKRRISFHLSIFQVLPLPSQPWKAD